VRLPLGRVGWVYTCTTMSKTLANPPLSILPSVNCPIISCKPRHCKSLASQPSILPVLCTISSPSCQYPRFQKLYPHASGFFTSGMTYFAAFVWAASSIAPICFSLPCIMDMSAFLSCGKKWMTWTLRQPLLEIELASIPVELYISDTKTEASKTPEHNFTE